MEFDTIVLREYSPKQIEMQDHAITIFCCYYQI